MKKVWLYFSNGVFLEADSFGADGTMVGDVVFNTSMGATQEVISDPSSGGVFINFTMSEIGNYGTNEQDDESEDIKTKGILVRNYQDRYSNFRATSSLGAYLKKHSVMGICNIDTRYITTMIRDNGILKMVASTEFSDKEKLAKLLQDSKDEQEFLVTNQSYKHTNSIFNFKTLRYDEPPLSQAKVLVLDLGVKKSTLSELVNAKMSVEVIPYNTDAKIIIDRYNSKDIDGVVISSGAIEPNKLSGVVDTIKKLQDAKVPLLGIGLAHHLVALANNLELKKLSFGHHGSNHPVRDIASGKVEQYAQNHIYTISSDPSDIATITHTNIFDGTIEGLRYNNIKAITTEFYPASSSQYLQTSPIYTEFLSLLKR
ncbi:MAG: glutamine-hydrolyzing carbamoyl-phosphate synthase small subunit [Sulfurimonas sp.]|jgi:carbamoyl-phosphate synthase small subunit|nr:glutamine-hydrolyzing carbamoyl-phosphate synthase small subunit [Sulfurimonadaceae bacterium]